SPGDATALGAGCPECARLHRSSDHRVTGIEPSLAPSPGDVARADLDAAANLLVLAACNALEVARGLRLAAARAVVVDLEQRSVIAEPVRPHHACPLCFPVAPLSREGLRAAVLRWRNDVLPAPGEDAVDDSTLRERLRALTGRRFAMFEPPRTPSPLQRHALWRFFRERGVDPRDNALANAAFVNVHRSRMPDDATLDHVGTGFD